MIKTTIIVILYYLKRNTNNEAKLHVIYICWSKAVRTEFLFTLFSELLHEKKILKSVTVTFRTNF